MINKLLQLQSERSELFIELSNLNKSWQIVQNAFIDSTKIVRDEIMKGGGLNTLLTKPISDKFQKSQDNYESNVDQISTKIQFIDEELDKIYKSEGFKDLKHCTNIVSIKDFINNVNLIKSNFDQELYSQEEFDLIRKGLLQYIDFEYEDQLFKAREKRTYYADLIILNEKNEILFVQRNKEDHFEPGKFALPGGHIEPAEEAEIAVRRETEEELNLNFNDKNLIPVGTYQDDKCKIHYFLVQIKSDEYMPILEERELTQYQWTPIKEIASLDLIMNLKENFEKVIDLPITPLINL